MNKLGARLTSQLGATASAFDDSAALERVIGDLVERGERALPHHPVAHEAFVDRLAAALATTTVSVTLARLEALRAEDLYLACALATGDPAAITLAESTLIPAAREVVSKIDRSPAFVDDVVQRVRLRVLVGEDGAEPTIAQYRGAGPLASWIRVVARRIALDRKRAAGAYHEGEEGLDQLPAPDDPELAVIWRSCAAEYGAALARAFAALERRDRTLLRQRYVDDLNIDALGRLHGVNPATAFRWIKRIEQQLVAATRAELVEKLALTDSQLRSMDRVVSDRLELSLSGILRGRPR